ncbi:hypothetical protein Aca07nite_38620 [Actinoplanes capillaceus]|uniref:Vitamin K epoxide reductase family protein n=1 Tax=Actinoplanes campanulatus TaxID=113559 RepID=A0ABQ3WK15_9ACTN|nr:hypothetical protein [Actinoplanes capillaceus]GID46587.1 hypothetical protein Aca07nite_38620 [Actinoplanes capillaceus]
MTTQPAPAQPGWFTRERYGTPAAVGVSALAFLGLLIFAGYTLFEGSHMMSNHCFDATDQIVCPIDGPDWIRPVPGWAVLLGLLAGLAGSAVGRPLRRPGLIAGFVWVTVALILIWVFG